MKLGHSILLCFYNLYTFVFSDFLLILHMFLYILYLAFLFLSVLSFLFSISFLHFLLSFHLVSLLNLLFHTSYLGLLYSQILLSYRRLLFSLLRCLAKIFQILLIRLVYFLYYANSILVFHHILLNLLNIFSALSSFFLFRV